MDKKNSEPEVEVFEDEDDSGLDALIKSARENRSNRFVRKDPASYAEKATTKEAPKPAANDIPKSKTNPTEAEDESNNTAETVGNRVAYCHYFSNYGQCHYKEIYNRPCKFSHVKCKGSYMYF